VKASFDPLCDLCWEAICNAHGGAQPMRVPEYLRDIEECCVCGEATMSGLYADVEAPLKRGAA
jgi:hypothetical protein